MTPQDLRVAAQMIRGILKGRWTAHMPVWAENEFLQEMASDVTPRTRAVQTAEFIVQLAHLRSPGFDEPAFLRDCGLVP